MPKEQKLSLVNQISPVTWSSLIQDSILIFSPTDLWSPETKQVFFLNIEVHIVGRLNYNKNKM